MFLTEAATAMVFRLALRLAMSMTLAVRLIVALAVLFVVLLCCTVGSSSAAAAPPSASFPPGVAGRRIRSLIHIALYVVSFPAGRGTPTSIRRTCWPHFRTLVRETLVCGWNRE